MSGLSRRAFLAAVGASAVAWAVPTRMLGRALASPAAPADVVTTLTQTIRLAAPHYRKYRTLAIGPGEPYEPRLDVLGRAPDAARVAQRRSLAYLGHMTDIHMIDAQSPTRIEPLAGQSPTTWAGVVRPQDTMTAHVTAAMVEAMSQARLSPVTGAPMSAVVVTGDSADMHSELELSWYITALDGGEILPNSGAPGIYEGVQAWPEATYAWHPDDPDIDAFGAYGFPRIPGLLDAVVSSPVQSVGLPVPWFAVYGNHDTLLLGTFGIDSQTRARAVGDRKAATWEALASGWLGGLAATGSLAQRAGDTLTSAFGSRPGMRSMTPDPARKLFEQREFMAAHLRSPAVPGPVGHGFTPANVETGQTWWTADVGANVRLFGLDTCNQIAGPDGAVPAEQFEWLKQQLAVAERDRKLSVVLSHHNSTTLENGAVPAIGPAQRLYHAEEFVSMLLSFRTVVAWINGHTHINTITPHRRASGGGFWEVTAASCVDFPQQQQLVELVDNRDGTLSIFTTTVDHASAATWTDRDFSQAGLASLSRQLAANDWVENPTMRLGSPLDRNCELLVEAPFDLSTISDADLEAARAADLARLLAYGQGQAEAGSA